MVEHACFNCKARVMRKPTSYFNGKGTGRCNKRGLMDVQPDDVCEWWEEEGNTPIDENIIQLAKSVSQLIGLVGFVHSPNHLPRWIKADLEKINKEVIRFIPEKDRWYYER